MRKNALDRALFSISTRSSLNVEQHQETNPSQSFHRTYQNIVGVDEVGRGSLAGPVMAAVMFNSGMTKNKFIEDFRHLNDSKRVTALRRARLAAEIRISGLVKQ